MKNLVKYYDIPILIYTSIFLILSIAGIYSATIHETDTFFKKQILFVSLSFLILLIFPLIDYRKLINYSIFLYILGVISLIYVKFFGVTVLGAKRWINLGFFSLQPSEFMKYITVLFIAYVLSVAKIPITWKETVKIIFITFIPFFLTLKQPDLGTAITILIPALFIMFLANIDKRYIIASLLTVLIASPFIWMNLKEYQKNRILAFINPEADPYGSAYHIIQSEIAIGSGKITGKGFLHGTQSKLMFLPEQHTDFIFATISEEFGFMVSSVIVLLYLLLSIRILYFGKNIKEKAGKFICYGFGGLIVTQAFINIAMTVGMAPVVGITLPFLSYGGSSLLTFSMIIGTVLSVIRINKMEKIKF